MFLLHSKEEVFNFFSERKIQAEFIEGTEKDYQTASVFQRAGIHATDALHAALANHV